MSAYIDATRYSITHQAVTELCSQALKVAAMKETAAIKAKELELDRLRAETLRLRESKEASKAAIERLRLEIELAAMKVRQLELEGHKVQKLAHSMDVDA